MPAHSQPTNARDFETTAIHLKPIPILLETETFETVFPFEAWIARLFPDFDTAKERLKRLVQILHDRLQHMAVYWRGIGIGCFIRLDLAQLVVLAHSAPFLRIGIFALGETAVVPVTTGL
jgi:hypothetical protein